MKNWMDLNGDGKMDGTEMMFAEEMLCTSREEHEALFGDAGDFEDDTKEDFEIETAHPAPAAPKAGASDPRAQAGI